MNWSTREHHQRLSSVTPMIRLAIAPVLAITAVAASTQAADYTARSISLSDSSVKDGAGATSVNFNKNNINAAGDAAGTNTLYSSSGANAGTAVWHFSHLTPNSPGARIGLFDLIHTQGNATGGTQSSSIANIGGINAAGYTVGTSTRYNGATSLGSDGWVYHPTIGTVAFDPSALVDPASAGSYVKSDGTRSVSLYGASASGATAGTATRYNSGGTSLGTDVWYKAAGAGSTPIIISFTDATHTNNSGNRSASSGGAAVGIPAINANGYVLGTNTVYSGASIVTNANPWLYRPGVGTTLIGLRGAGYQSLTGAMNFLSPRLNDLNQAAGGTTRYDSSGNNVGLDLWVYQVDSGQLSTITLDNSLAGTDHYYTLGTGSDARRTFTIGQLTNNGGTGFVSGAANRVNANGDGRGRDAFIYSVQDGIARRAGLTEGNAVVGYTRSDGTRQSATFSGQTIGDVFVNKFGEAGGSSTRYATGTSTVLGTDAWYFSYEGNATVKITPSDPAFENANGYVAAKATLINSTGLVAGSAARFLSGSTANTPSLGTAAFIFDPDATGDKTTVIDLSQDSFGTINSTVNFLSDSNIAVGSYTKYNGEDTVGTYAFVWTPELGAVDLATLVDPALSPSTWAAFANALAVGPNGSLFVTGAPLTGGTAAYYLSVVPEPTSLAFLGLGVLGMIRRKRA